ncbi:hypothetical protein P20652_0147 [Pseudoalteromonas sp. BSi20652]|nr:hypothetical protein P20652_0147 [Pseudoalteromonas sp. BSi20652]
MIIVDQFIFVSFEEPLLTKWYGVKPKAAGIKKSGYHNIEAANIF